MYHKLFLVVSSYKCVILFAIIWPDDLELMVFWPTDFGQIVVFYRKIWNNTSLKQIVVHVYQNIKNRKQISDLILWTLDKRSKVLTFVEPVSKPQNVWLFGAMFTWWIYCAVIILKVGNRCIHFFLPFLVKNTNYFQIFNNVILFSTNESLSPPNHIKINLITIVYTFQPSSSENNPGFP